MKQGDLVKPWTHCAGQAGAAPCNVAVVLEPRSHADSHKAKIVCPCGVADVYRVQLNVINPDLAFSADPM